MKTPCPRKAASLLPLVVACLGIGVYCTPLRSFADPVALEITEGLPGSQARLSWPSVPGARYRVERSPDLSPGSFKTIAMVDASGALTDWHEAEPLGARMFYRVVKPIPEVFSIEPAVFQSSGGMVHVFGSGFPAGALLRIEVEGTGIFFRPLIPVSPGIWAVPTPGGLPHGGHVTSLLVTDETGTVNVSAEISSSITVVIAEDGRASDGPIGLPPAAPVPATEVAIKTKGTGAEPVRLAPPRSGVAIKTKGTGAEPVRVAAYGSGGVRMGSGAHDGGGFSFIQPGGHGPATQGIPGEVCLHACDLELAAPAGPPLRWIRTYRSLAQVPESGHGPGWDHCYHIFIEPIPVTAGATASRVRVYDGAGASFILHRGADGVFSASGVFRTGQFTGNTFVLTFADKGTWTFLPLDGSSTSGKIHTITDRFGNSLTCAYNGGRLSSIGDSFGRALTVNWDTDRIVSVADTNGRHVVFAYGDDGGGSRVLTQVPPAMSASDAPGSGTLVYDYADHSGPALTLIAVRDEQGVIFPREMFAYSSVADPNNLSFRRLISHITSDGPGTTLHYESLADGVAPFRGYTVFHNDPTGRVTEITCDAMHRPVRMLQLTGLAVPGTAVTSSTNRPGMQIRPGDPAQFETTFSYNTDHNLRRCECPLGSYVSFTYDREMNPAVPSRERGNLRVMSQHSPGGEVRTVICDFLPGFGTSEAARPGNPIRGMTVKGGRNPAGDIQPNGIAARPGNPIGGISIKGGKNPGGNLRSPYFHQTTSGGDDDCDGMELPSAKPGGPVRWASAKVRGGGSGMAYSTSRFSLGYLDFGDVLDTDDDGDGWLAGARHRHKGWDGVIYGNHRQRNKGWDGVIYGNPKRTFSGTFEGGMPEELIFVLEATKRLGGSGHALFAKEEGGRRKPFFKSYSAAERGISIRTTHVESACDVEMPALFRKILDYGEAGDNIGSEAGFVTRFVNSRGQLWSWVYNEDGALLSGATPISGSGFTATHDVQGRLTSFSVLDGATSHTLSIEIGGDGFPSRVTQDPGGLHLDTQFGYDACGRIIRITDALGRDREFVYDALDRCIEERSPVVGSSRVSTRYHFNGTRQLARIDHDHRDAEGNSFPGNAEYSVCCVRDSYGRVVRIAEEERPVDLPIGEFDPASVGLENFAVIDFTLDAAGRLIRCAIPAACRGATNDRAIEFEHDERGLLCREIDGGSLAVSPITREFAYDLHGNPVVQTIVAPGLAPAVTTTTYDGFHRPVAIQDPMGNCVYYTYGNRGEITVEVYGETIDLPGTIGNVRLSSVTYVGPCDASPDVVALSLPGVAGVNYGVNVDPPLTPASRFAPAWHGFERRDHTVVVSRFVPSSSAVAEETTIVTCSPAGLPQRITRNTDILLELEYDSAGRLTAVSNAACRTDATLDVLGRPISVCRSDFSSANPALTLAFTRTFSHDRLDRIVSATSGGNTTTFAYDSCDRLVRRVAASGHPIHIAYDGIDSTGAYSRQISDGDLDGDGAADVLFACLERCGERLRLRNAHPGFTSATYDELGRCVRIDYPDGRFTTAAYDGRGSLVHQTLCDGSTRGFATDLNGRVTETTYGSLPVGVVPVLPQQASYDGLGRCTRLAEGGHVLTWTYDSRGNIVSESQNGVVVERVFNHRGRVAMRVIGSTTSQIEERDALGRLTAVFLATPSGVPVSPAISTIQYLGLRVSRCDQNNGTTIVHTYRADGEPALDSAFEDFSHDDLVETTVTRGVDLVMRERAHRNRNGTVTATTCDFAHANNTQRRARLFTLDPLDRTTRYQSLFFVDASSPPAVEADIAYTLAVDGARRLITGGNNPGPYSQVAGDQPMQRYSSWPRGTVTWDSNGNLASLQGSDGFGQISCELDAAGRLRTVVEQGGTTTRSLYQHDALGRRFFSQIDNADGLPPETTTFVFDGHVCIEERSGGAVLVSYLHVGGSLHRCDAGSMGVFFPAGGLSASTPKKGKGTVVKSPVPRDCDDEADSFSLFTNAAGIPVELRGCDDAATPLFYTADGVPTGASRSSLPIRWLAPACFWDHASRLTHLPGGSYSPDLGTQVITPPKATTGKKEYTGHVTLLK